jgi:hypothetical protein
LVFRCAPLPFRDFQNRPNKSMKNQLSIVLLTFLPLCISLQAEVHTLRPIDELGFSVPIEVAADEYFRVIYVANPGMGFFYVGFGDEDELIFANVNPPLDWNSPNGGGPTNLTLRGPLTVRSHGDLATIEVLKADRRGPDLGPSNSVVIPSDSSGPVEIILESSVDLISWAAALPGTYGASTERRFFRLRAVSNID